MNGYSLAKDWYAFTECADGKILPSHHALYHYLIHLANSLEWKEVFLVVPEVAMARTGISSILTFKKCFDDLETFGFIEVKERRVNAFSSYRISLKDQSPQEIQPIPILEKPKKPRKPRTAKPKVEEVKEIKDLQEIREVEKPVSIQANKPPTRAETATRIIATFFEISEIHQSGHYFKIARFVHEQEKAGKLDYLSKQFSAYAELKKSKNGYKHNWANYIGTPDKNYEDGGWNLENWASKLEEHKAALKAKQTNGFNQEPQKPIKIDYSAKLKRNTQQ